ncbi:hypothetical protein E6O75_ATG02261 [Venturia nashicola]|uniref:Uncharacterized protein n=1 Tax=Venturia nashicola TaxID=86259 RepID=A0A4Z1P356_9PEZI|nr:hypothetical protein E6O75_ATG02261 [Venturia nashicola]
MPAQDLQLVVITVCSAAIMTLAAVVFSRQRAAPTFVIREEAFNQVQGQIDNLLASVRDLTITVTWLSQDVAISQNHALVGSRTLSGSTCSVGFDTDDELFPPDESRPRLPSLDSSEPMFRTQTLPRRPSSIDGHVLDSGSFVMAEKGP